jgi:peptide/nickel transport system permease protein
MGGYLLRRPSLSSGGVRRHGARLLIIHLTPGDPRGSCWSRRAAKTVETLRHELGLGQPIYMQYGRWIERAPGDLGRSSLHRPVLGEVVARFRARCCHSGDARSFLSASPRRVVSGQARLVADRVSIFGSNWPESSPFWFGMVLIMIFTVECAVPGTGMTSPSRRRHRRHREAHGVAHAGAERDPLAVIARYTRSAMLESFPGRRHRHGQRRCGRRRCRPCVPQCLVLIVTMLGLVGFLLAGAVYVSVFSWPGRPVAGQAILKRDFPLVRAAFCWWRSPRRHQLAHRSVLRVFDPRIRLS